MVKVGDMSQKDWMKKLQEINPDVSEADAKAMKEKQKNRELEVALLRVENKVKPFAPASEAVTEHGYYLSSVDQRDKKTRELNGTVSLFIMEDEEGKRSLSKVVLYGSELPFKPLQKYELEGRRFDWAINATKGVKEIEGKIARADVINIFKKLAVPVRDVEMKESAVLCVAMASEIKKIPSLFEESGEEDNKTSSVSAFYDFFVPVPKKLPEDMKKMPNSGLAMDISSQDVDGDWVNVRVVPQALGKIEMNGIIDDDDLDDLAQCKKSEDQEAMLKEIVPSRDHPTYVFGFMKKIKAKGERTYRTFRGTFAIRDLRENFAEASKIVSQHKKPAKSQAPLLEENAAGEVLAAEGEEAPDEESPDEESPEISMSDAVAEVNKWLDFNPKTTLASVIRASKGTLERYDQEKLKVIYETEKAKRAAKK